CSRRCVSSSGATVATAGSTGSRVGLYRDQGVVLRSIRLGEADRIVSFITEGRGKVRAVAKGVRKTKSRFGARLEPTVHVSLLLSLEGFHPVLETCATCGATDDLVAFDLSQGGVLCSTCGRGALPLGPGSLDLLRRILGGGLGPALNEPAGPATDEIAHLATRALEHHLERRLRSMALLDRG